MRSERMLVSMKRFIGDSVMATPLLNALEAEYQPLTVVCSKPVAQVLQSPSSGRQFLPLDTRRKPWEVLQSAMELRRMRFGVAVLVNHSFRSALTARLAGIRKRIGHPSEGRGWLLTDCVPYSEDKFESWCNSDLAGPLGIEVPRSMPTLAVTEAERKLGAELLKGATVGVQPGARYPEKSLPPESLAEVSRRLQDAGHTLALLGAAEEKDAASRLASQLSKPVVDLVGGCDIRGSLGALSHLRLMLGADTGLMHMAVAVGCPTVTVFGPTPAKKWGHFYEPHRVVLAPDADMSKLDPQELYRTAAERLE